MDKRHELRIKIVQELYSLTFISDNSKSKSKLQSRTQEIIKKTLEINEVIKKYAPKFPLEKIAKVDLAILQLGVYELLFEKKEPIKVIIDEAVELGKELGSSKSYSFINAVLGKANKELQIKDKK